MLSVRNESLSVWNVPVVLRFFILIISTMMAGMTIWILLPRFSGEELDAAAFNQENQRSVDASQRLENPANDLARFLAGFELKPSSSLYALSQTEEAADHRRSMESYWRRLRHDVIEPMTAFRKGTLEAKYGSPLCPVDRPAIYPMSGGDLVNLMTLCPQAREYLMIAMEEPGALPDPLANPAIFFDGLRGTRQVIENISQMNYFQSRLMYFHITANRRLPGMLPVILLFAGGLDLRVMKVEPIYLGPSGQVETSSDGWQGRTSGFRIYFLSQEDSRIRSLVYLKQRLDPSSLKNTSPMGVFFQESAGSTMLLKSAIYLLHDPVYSPMRDVMIKIPDMVIQDDSGFLFRDLKVSFPDVALFGRFLNMPLTGDIAPENVYQPDLVEEYNRVAPPRLEFHFGYGALRSVGDSTLIVARRKSQTTSH